MSETVEIPRTMYDRMHRALIGIEKFLEQREEEKVEWVTEAKALELLGCSKRHLYNLKGSHIKYKAVGKAHQYSRKSIEKYNQLMSV